MKLSKMIEIYLKYDNMHTIRTINAFICINNHVNSCIKCTVSIIKFKEAMKRFFKMTDVSFSCVVKTQRRWSKKIYKTELTKIRYNNQVLCKYRVDPKRAGLTLIAELTWSNLGLKGVLNKRK